MRPRKKDLTDFFTRWGLIPDETTAAYLAQFPAEERAVYYVNDSARDYALTHPDAAGAVTGLNVVDASVPQLGPSAADQHRRPGRDPRLRDRPKCYVCKRSAPASGGRLYHRHFLHGHRDDHEQPHRDL